MFQLLNILIFIHTNILASMKSAIDYMNTLSKFGFNQPANKNKKKNQKTKEKKSFNNIALMNVKGMRENYLLVRTK
jgi:hypothetical protein